eukprot:Pgem_evm1s4519
MQNKESSQLRKKCIDCNITYPSFNYPGKNPPLYCNSCKLAGMINLKAKLCINGCSERAYFALECEKYPQYCKLCKTPDMVHVIKQNPRNKCLSCKLFVPSFNYAGETPHYCVKCKLPGMINLRHKTCINGCSGRAYYNYTGESSSLYCSKCKTAEMQRAKGSHCHGENCDSRPSFNYPCMKRALYCLKCKLSGMVNLSKLPKCNCGKRAGYNFP